MTPKQFVLKQFRTAVCEPNGDIKQVVALGPYGRAMELGQARNIRHAWYVAAWNLGYRTWKHRQKEKPRG